MNFGADCRYPWWRGIQICCVVVWHSALALRVEMSWDMRRVVEVKIRLNISELPTCGHAYYGKWYPEVVATILVGELQLIVWRLAQAHALRVVVVAVVSKKRSTVPTEDLDDLKMSKK